MKICQVNPGCGIEIPPKGWGAVEKIVWEFTTNLRKQGHQVDIKWTDEIKKGEYDIVHVHIANLALILAKRGIPYIFQCHDHHAYHYGKDSFIFKQNLEAIENSELSILPAKYLVDYFGSKKAVYFSHGVDTEFFTPNLGEKPHKLLMVANNGLGGGDGYDRKGFTQGIQAAKGIGLPITIAGPENNKKFIEENPWVKSHNINWVFNPNQKELLKLYQEHTIFLHPSELEAGHPNLTLLEAMSCGLPVVGCMEGDLEGMVRVKKSTKAVYDGIKKILSSYEKYKHQSITTAHNLSWYNRSKELLNLIKPQTMKDILIKEYSTTPKRIITPKPPQVEATINFIEGAKCELKGNTSHEYKVQFLDNNNIIWEDTIRCGMWTKTDKKYFTPWNVKITNTTTGEKVLDYHFNCENKKVYIQLDSKSIGDTIAWFPYVEEFRKKHNCKIYCSTFHNDWFKSEYPEINFVAPGSYIEDVYAQYNVGWYYFDNGGKDMNKHPQDFLSIPLQQSASDILGLEYKEIAPKITTSNKPSPIKEKYVTLSIQSTSQAKYWNYKGGWQLVVNFLKQQGYKVVLVDQHKVFGLGGFMNEAPKGVLDYTNKSLNEVFTLIQHADFHLGISSGLSWVSWALGTHVVMVSSFSKPWCEFQSNCTRIYNDTPTSGYFNTHKLNPSNWNWYPFKEIESMKDWYEIENITPEQVISEIKQLL